MAHAGQQSFQIPSHTARCDVLDEGTVSAGRRPTVTALSGALGGQGPSSCSGDAMRRCQDPGAFAHVKHPAMARKGRTLRLYPVVLAGVHLLAVATLLQPALALTRTVPSSSSVYLVLLILIVEHAYIASASRFSLLFPKFQLDE